MNRTNAVPDGSLLVLAAAAASVALPPTGSCVLVPSSWTSGGDVVPEVELELWADTAAVAVTVAKLYAGILHPKTWLAFAMTSASAGTNLITKNGHGLLTGDGPFTFTTAAGLPDGLTVATPYWAIVPDANTFKVALSFADAMAGVFVDLTTNGTDATTTSSSDTRTLRWHVTELLGLAGDGAIALSTTAAYRKRVAHSPRAVAYAMVATLDTSTVSACITPITSAS